MKTNEIGKVFSLERIEFDTHGNYEIQEITDTDMLDEIGGGAVEVNIYQCNSDCKKYGEDGDPIEE